MSDTDSSKRIVPALRYENTITGGEGKSGTNVVRFDGFDGSLSKLLDAKNNTYSMKRGTKSASDAARQSLAISQNPGFSLTLELPTDGKTNSAGTKLINLGIRNINTRTRK